MNHSGSLVFKRREWLDETMISRGTGLLYVFPVFAENPLIEL